VFRFEPPGGTPAASLNFFVRPPGPDGGGGGGGLPPPPLPLAPPPPPAPPPAARPNRSVNPPEPPVRTLSFKLAAAMRLISACIEALCESFQREGCCPLAFWLGFTLTATPLAGTAKTRPLNDTSARPSPVVLPV